MKLKDIDAVEVGISVNGKIILNQTSSEENFIYLTLDQFSQIATWVVNHVEEIEELWNGGIVNADDDNG